MTISSEHHLCSEENLHAVGIEPTTFHMRSENHTPRPSARDSNKILSKYILQF